MLGLTNLFFNYKTGLHLQVLSLLSSPLLSSSLLFSSPLLSSPLSELILLFKNLKIVITAQIGGAMALLKVHSTKIAYQIARGCSEIVGGDRFTFVLKKTENEQPLSKTNSNKPTATNQKNKPKQQTKTTNQNNKRR